jgi:hypothetical protein
MLVGVGGRLAAKHVVAQLANPFRRHVSVGVRRRALAPQPVAEMRWRSFCELDMAHDCARPSCAAIAQPHAERYWHAVPSLCHLPFSQREVLPDRQMVDCDATVTLSYRQLRAPSGCCTAAPLPQVLPRFVHAPSSHR